MRMNLLLAGFLICSAVLSVSCTAQTEKPYPGTQGFSSVTSVANSAVKSSQPSTFTVQGSVTLRGVAPIKDLTTGRCEGGSAAAYASEGAQVTIVNETGVTVGVGRLSPGSWTVQGTCVFAYTVQVAEANFYTARVGTSVPITFSGADAHTQSVGLVFG